MVVLGPEPVVVTAPGDLVNVQFPDGKPLNTTLPVATLQVGWVTVPTVGAEGVAGCASITTFNDDEDIQPPASVTVYV
jgi:hypothetical protein